MSGNGWPCVVPDKVYVGNQESSVAVCTLWKPLNEFCREVSQKILGRICIVGQLRDPSGLGYMVRNILANPRIRYLVICGHDAVLEDKAESKDRLSTKNLLELFFDQKTSLEIISRYIDGIPTEDVLSLVRNIKLIDLYQKEINQVNSGIKAALINGKNDFWAIPKFFPIKQANKNQIPALRGSTIVADTVVDGYVLLLKNLFNYGVFQERKKYPEGTLCGFSIKVIIKKEDPENLFFDEEHLPPGCNKGYLERQYFPQVVGCKIPKGEEYSYGSLLAGQIDRIIAFLAKDKNSKDAVASLWNPDHIHGNPPCFVFAQALILENQLHFICNMRSHNIIKCWAENTFAFRKLQGVIYERLKRKYGDLELGDLIVHSISAQINLNTQQIKIAESILRDRFKNGRKLGYKAVRRKYFSRDVVNCYITVENNNIVLYLRGQGKIFREYRAPTARAMKDIIHLDGLDFLSDHAMYIGITLAEAEVSLKLDLPFEQDKKLKLGNGLEIDKSRGIAIAVDFDGVIHGYSEGWKDGSIYDKVVKGAKKALWQLKKEGFFLIIYSTRGNKPHQRKEMEAYLKKNKIPFDLIAIGGKPYSRYYIDDKGIRFFNWKKTLSEIKKLEKEENYA